MSCITIAETVRYTQPLRDGNMKTIRTGKDFTGNVMIRHKACKFSKRITVENAENASHALSLMSHQTKHVKAEPFTAPQGTEWTVRMTRFGEFRDLIVTCTCGLRIQAGTYGQPMYGRFVESVICNDKCMSAVGPNCECSCGGAHHGESH